MGLGNLPADRSLQSVRSEICKRSASPSAESNKQSLGEGDVVMGRNSKKPRNGFHAGNVCGLCCFNTQYSGSNSPGNPLISKKSKKAAGVNPRPSCMLPPIHSPVRMLDRAGTWRRSNGHKRPAQRENVRGQREWPEHALSTLSTIVSKIPQFLTNILPRPIFSAGLEAYRVADGKRGGHSFGAVVRLGPTGPSPFAMVACEIRPSTGHRESSTSPSDAASFHNITPSRRFLGICAWHNFLGKFLNSEKNGWWIFAKRLL